MGTGQRIYPHRGTNARLAAAIAQWRDNVIDLDTAVDDKEAAVMCAVDELRAAVHERHRGAAQLHQLIDLALNREGPVSMVMIRETAMPNQTFVPHVK